MASFGLSPAIAGSCVRIERLYRHGSNRGARNGHVVIGFPINHPFTAHVTKLVDADPALKALVKTDANGTQSLPGVAIEMWETVLAAYLVVESWPMELKLRGEEPLTLTPGWSSPFSEDPMQQAALTPNGFIEHCKNARRYLEPWLVEHRLSGENGPTRFQFVISVRDFGVSRTACGDW